MLVCLTENCEQNVLGGGKRQKVSPLWQVSGSQTGIPKDLGKIQNFRGKEGLTILEIGGHGGYNILEFPKGRV